MRPFGQLGAATATGQQQAITAPAANDSPFRPGNFGRFRSGKSERLVVADGAVKRAQQSLGYDDLLLAWWLLPQEPATAAQLRARVDHHLCALCSRFIPDEILDGFKCAVPRA